MIYSIKKEKMNCFFLKPCFFILLFLFATSQACATLIALDEADPSNSNSPPYNILLFSDYHGKKLQKYDKQQLETLEHAFLIERQNQTTNPKEMLILVEDPADLYKDTKANVLEKGNGLLIGLVKKLKSLTLKNTKIKNLEIRDVCGQACGFFAWCYPPPSFAYSPNEKKINPYSFSFYDLFEELDMLLDECKKIKKNLKTNQNLSSVIDDSVVIGIFENKLHKAQSQYKTLLLQFKKHNITVEDSILEKATQFFLDDLASYDYKNNYTKRLNELKISLKKFAQGYPHFSQKDWESLTKKYEKERDDLIKSILNDNPYYTNKSISMTSRYIISEPLFGLTNNLLELCLLYEIITNLSEKIIVFAGAKHTKAVVEMLSFLGITFKSFGENNIKNPTQALDQKYIYRI